MRGILNVDTRVSQRIQCEMYRKETYSKAKYFSSCFVLELIFDPPFFFSPSISVFSDLLDS